MHWSFERDELLVQALSLLHKLVHVHLSLDHTNRGRPVALYHSYTRILQIGTRKMHGGSVIGAKEWFLYYSCF